RGGTTWCRRTCSASPSRCSRTASSPPATRCSPARTPRGSSPTSSRASRRPARSRHEPPDDGRGRGLTVGALAGLRLTRRGVAALVCAVALLALGGWASYPGLVGLGVALALALLAALVGVAVPVPVSVRRTVRPLRVPRLADCS